MKPDWNTRYNRLYFAVTQRLGGTAYQMYRDLRRKGLAAQDALERAKDFASKYDPDCDLYCARHF